MPQTKADIPSPPIWNALTHFSDIIHNPAKRYKDLLDSYGPLIDLWTPAGRVYLTDDAELIRQVLQKKHSNYRKTHAERERLSKFVGKGLLTSDGPYWLKQRRAIQPGFHSKRLEAISGILRSEIRSFMDGRLSRYVESGEAVDMAQEMTRLAFKMVSSSLFGQDIEEEKIQMYGEMIHSDQQEFVNRLRRPYYVPWMHLSGEAKRNKQLHRKGIRFVKEVIDGRRKDPEPHEDFLDMLLATRYEDGSQMSDQQLLDEVHILYTAGHETTAKAMAWTWYLLAEHPEVEEKLLNFTHETLGTSDPTFQDLRTLTYTKQIADESMRLYPPAWMIARELIDEDEFHGHRLKAKQNIICLVYGVHRNPRYWKDPERFDPDRFSPENKKNIIPYSHVPFGGGPRMCIGASFSMMEIQLVLSMIIREYRFELIPGQDIDIHPLITLTPRNGIMMKVTKR